MMTRFIAAGFMQDAEKLINEFVEAGSVEFPSFAEIWKKRNFVAVYMGRDENEIYLFTNEIFQISLSFFQSNTFLQQVGAVYLIYALYRNQLATPFVKVRITMPQMEVFNNILATAKQNNYRTLQFVAEFLLKNAFDFVAFATLQGPKAGKEKADHDGISHACALEKDIKSSLNSLRDSKVLQNLSDLTEKYASLKQKVFPNDPQKSKVEKNRYDEYVSWLDDLIDDKSDTSSKVASGKKESDIGSRRTQIKAAAFSNKACFQKLNPSDEEMGNVEQPKPAARRHRKKYNRSRKKCGRPSKDSLNEALLDSAQASENLGSEVDAPQVKRGGKKGAKKKQTFLEAANIEPMLLNMDLKKEIEPMLLNMDLKKEIESSCESEHIVSEKNEDSLSNFSEKDEETL